jgi:hypothetical protein
MATHSSQQPNTPQIQPELMQREHVKPIFSRSEEDQEPEEREKCTKMWHGSRSQDKVEQIKGKDIIDVSMPKQVRESVPKYVCQTVKFN